MNRSRCRRNGNGVKGGSKIPYHRHYVNKRVLVAAYPHTKKGKKKAQSRASYLRRERNAVVEVKEGTLKGRKCWKIWGKA